MYAKSLLESHDLHLAGRDRAPARPVARDAGTAWAAAASSRNGFADAPETATASTAAPRGVPVEDAGLDPKLDLELDLELEPAAGGEPGREPAPRSEGVAEPASRATRDAEAAWARAVAARNGFGDF